MAVRSMEKKKRPSVKFGREKIVSDLGGNNFSGMRGAESETR